MRFITLFFLSIGASTWLYTKVQKRTGNNTRSSLIVAGTTFAVLFILLWISVPQF